MYVPLQSSKLSVTAKKAIVHPYWRLVHSPIYLPHRERPSAEWIGKWKWLNMRASACFGTSGGFSRRTEGTWHGPVITIPEWTTVFPLVTILLANIISCFSANKLQFLFQIHYFVICIPYLQWVHEMPYFGGTWCGWRHRSSKLLRPYFILLSSWTH